jgi:hypothetical protein
MSFKIGERPTVRMPTIDLNRTERARVTDRMPAFSPSSFTPAPAAPPVVLQPPPPPQKTYGPAAFWGFDQTKLDSPLKLNDQGEVKSAKYTFGQAVQKYGMPQNDADVKGWYDNLIRPELESKGFKCGPLVEDRGHFSAMIATREDPQGGMVGLLRTDGVGGPGTKATWDTDVGGGSPTGAAEAAFGGFGIDDIFSDIKTMFANDKGFKAGATQEERNQTLERVRDEIIKRGRAKGLDLARNTKGNGQLSLDAIVVRPPGGEMATIDIARASKDLNQPINLQWLPVGTGGNYTPLADAPLGSIFDYK